MGLVQSLAEVQEVSVCPPPEVMLKLAQAH